MIIVLKPEATKSHAGAPPALLGFGISRPAHVRQAIELGAAGVISGSAVVRKVEQWIGTPGRQVSEVEDFVREMKAAAGTAAV
jgi:tryptophan synthase alpha chain